MTLGSVPTLANPAVLLTDDRADPALDRVDVSREVATLASPGDRAGGLGAIGAGGGTAGHAPALSTRVDLAPNVAAQVADLVRHAAGSGTLDVALQPEELGRLRLVFAPTELGISVSVQADRADTLDLLRRHADQLAADLRELGYAEVDLDFATPGDEGAGAASDETNGDLPPEDERAEDAPRSGGDRAHQRAGSHPPDEARLDLRL